MGSNCEEVGASRVYTSKNESCTDVTLMPDHDVFIQVFTCWRREDGGEGEAYRNRYCLSIVIAVTTRGTLPVLRACSSILLDIIAVVNSVSAAVPAPQQRMFSVI